MATNGDLSGSASGDKLQVADMLFAEGQFNHARFQYAFAAGSLAEEWRARDVGAALPLRIRYAEALAGVVVCDRLAAPHPSADPWKSPARSCDAIADAVSVIRPDLRAAMIRLGAGNGDRVLSDARLLESPEVRALVEGDLLLAVELKALPPTAVVPALQGVTAANVMRFDREAEAHVVVAEVALGSAQYNWVGAGDELLDGPRLREAARALDDTTGRLEQAAYHYARAIELFDTTGNRTAFTLASARAFRVHEALEVARNGLAPDVSRSL